MLDQLTKSTVYPIENWSNDLVKEWLAVVNLHRYAEVFAKYNINGSKLISLSSDQLYEYRIRDSFHHKAIIECCQELTFKSRQYSTYSQMLKELNEFRTQLNSMPYKASRHFFLVHTLSTQSICNTCSRPFLGIIHQCKHIKLKYIFHYRKYIFFQYRKYISNNKILNIFFSYIFSINVSIINTKINYIFE